ncbi:unnamed protein product [Sphenostylis stenocarpa]|uniref:Uncharacterized protein n=1 Tax=Sphenostylis stenocarpa TaxID=92480 RepID=A0AA86S1Z1_9FABA|nr:unnamed protein product [Sphenostylis stenocarpa]
MGVHVVVIKRRDLINKNYLSNNTHISGRLIPKRGQVKLGIVVGLFHTVSSLFSSITTRCIGLFSPSNHLIALSSITCSYVG